MSRQDVERRNRKAMAIAARMREVAAAPALMGLMDEFKLDMLLVVLGIAEVTSMPSNGDWMGGNETTR